MKITKETFETEAQWKKFLKIRELFLKLIELSDKGYFFLVDGEVWETPFIDGVNIGFGHGNCRLFFVGASFHGNDDEKPWIDISVTKIKKMVIPLKQEKLK